MHEGVHSFLMNMSGINLDADDVTDRPSDILIPYKWLDDWRIYTVLSLQPTDDLIDFRIRVKVTARSNVWNNLSWITYFLFEVYFYGISGKQMSNE